MAAIQGINRQKKQPYQRAQAKFEGGGIRRGLTPPEVAVILGKPYPRIVVLILVGLLNKGFVKLGTTQPLGFQVANQMRTREVSMSAKKRAEFRRQGAQNLKQVIFPFEEIFLEIIEQEEGKRIDEIDFGISVKPLIKLVSERIGGYDLSNSREYYLKIIMKETGGEDSKQKLDLNQNWFISWIILDFDNDIIQSDKDIKCNSEWLIDSISPTGSKITKKALIDWVKNIENLIKSGLAQNYFEFNLIGELNGISSEIIRDITHATYHG